MTTAESPGVPGTPALFMSFEEVMDLRRAG